MKNRVCAKRFLAVILLALLASLVASAAGADEWSRKGKRDFYGVMQMMSSDTTTISGSSVSMEVDKTTTYGFGFGANLDDHFNLNTDFLFGSTDVKGSNGVTLSPTQILWDINLDYNILKNRLTPLVSAGIGFMNFSGDDYAETDFSYNLGVGARWDATNNLFVKAMYRWTWTKLQDTDSGVMFDGPMICVGLMF